MFTPLEFKGRYTATSNNTKLVQWPFTGELLHLVQRGGDWVGPKEGTGWDHSLPIFTVPNVVNNPPINGQCINHRIAVQWSITLRF